MPFVEAVALAVCVAVLARPEARSARRASRAKAPRRALPLSVDVVRADDASTTSATFSSGACACGRSAGTRGTGAF